MFLESVTVDGSVEAEEGVGICESEDSGEERGTGADGLNDDIDDSFYCAMGGMDEDSVDTGTEGMECDGVECDMGGMDNDGVESDTEGMENGIGAAYSRRKVRKGVCVLETGVCDILVGMETSKSLYGGRGLQASL